MHFEGYSPEWRVLSKLSVQPCPSVLFFGFSCLLCFPFVSCHILVAFEGERVFCLFAFLPFCIVALFTYAYVLLNSVIIVIVKIVFFFFLSLGGGGCLLAILPYLLLSFPSSLTPSCLSGHSIAGRSVLLGVAFPPQSPTGQLRPGWDSSRV